MGLTGPSTVTTVLLAETLPTFLPPMYTYNVAYNALKQYQLVPLQSGVVYQARPSLTLQKDFSEKGTNESAWHNLQMPELVSSDSGQTVH